jgi:hypothetical protein
MPEAQSIRFSRVQMPSFSFLGVSVFELIVLTQKPTHILFYLIDYNLVVETSSLNNQRSKDSSSFLSSSFMTWDLAYSRIQTHLSTFFCKCSCHIVHIMCNTWPVLYNFQHTVLFIHSIQVLPLFHEVILFLSCNMLHLHCICDFFNFEPRSWVDPSRCPTCFSYELPLSCCHS